MLDFSGLDSGETTLADLGRDLRPADLHALTDEIVDTILEIIADATDDDVVFVPSDPEASDPGASGDEVNMAWTLGHVVVHTTASSEESAAMASSLARGVTPNGRSRYEVPWTTMKTVAQLRQRLEESRRIRHAFVDTWPAEPHLDLTITPIAKLGPLNPPAHFLLGMAHEVGHLRQLREIMRQARAARGG